MPLNKTKANAKTRVPKPKNARKSAGNDKPKEVYLPGRSRELKKGEELICDESAYTMLHSFDTAHPCLSFDIVADRLGVVQSEYPMSCCLVTGTQAEKIRDNRIIVLRLKNLHRHKEKEKDAEEDDDSSDSDSDAEEEPIMSAATITNHGGINRIRTTMLNNQPICAVWNDIGKVQIWSLEKCLSKVQDDTIECDLDKPVVVDEKPIFSFEGHLTEGFALDWSRIVPGKLISGDNRRNLHLWNVLEGGSWAVDQRPFNAHTSSVEDVQWSPSEDNVFASCSSDKTIRLWDCRVPPQQACICVVSNAHDKDVNVLSWNLKEPLLVSGGDDCALKVWDLKFIQNGSPVAMFKHHTKPITSVHWYEHDSTVFAAVSADNQVTVWDLAVEPDDEMEAEGASKEVEITPQLMFIHSGQEEIKEVRWHPQMTGTAITTALDSFNIFRPVNL